MTPQLPSSGQYLNARAEACAGDWQFLAFVGLIALAAAACDSTSSTTTGPTAVKCQVTLDAPASAVDPGGGATEIAVRTQPECAWTASAEAAWLSAVPPASGQGSGRIQIQVSANPLPSTRQGDIVVNGNRAAVRQAATACRFEVTPRTFAIEADAGSGTFSVVAATGCGWSAISQADWIRVTSGSPGNGNGAGEFTVAANAGSERVGTITVAGETLTLTQAAPAPPTPDIPCTYEITPTNQVIAVGGSTGNRVAVSAAPGCAWTATSGVPWITITGGASGLGSGAVVFSVSANPGASRTATLSIAGRPFSVTQAGLTPCAYSIAPRSQTIPASGGDGTPVAVVTTAACAWTASSNASWLTITSGATGVGNGVAGFSAATNNGNERTATLTIAGETFTVVQSAAAAPAPPSTPPPSPTPPPPTPAPLPPACTYSIAPASQSFGAQGGAGSPVSVSTMPTCSWQSVTNAGWISITSASAGTGNGSVSFTVAANLGAERSGTLTIAGQTFTVTQAAPIVPCSYQISPVKLGIGASGGSVSTAVSTSAGCAWTASSHDAWITITSATAGLGSGNLAFTVASHSGNTQRTGSLTVAGQTFTVEQAAAPAACAYSIAPASQSIGALGGAGTVVSVTTSAGCSWTSASQAAWLTITSGASGSANGSVGFNVAENTGAQRSGTLTIAGQTFTVTQAAAAQPCSYSINSTAHSIGLLGGPGRPVSVTAAAGCTWSARSNDSWITITSGASGSGNGTVEYIVGVLVLGSRTGTLTIAGQTYTVTQSGLIP